MSSLNPIFEKSIPNRCGLLYKGMAFDGCYFYFTCPELCEIVKYTENLCEVECIKVIRPYTCICYDSCNNCFWATTDCANNKLYKLDECFMEVDAITLESMEHPCGVITGVSYDCQQNRLVVSFVDYIVLVDVKCPKECILINQKCSVWNTGVLSIAPYYLVTELHNFHQDIVVYDDDFKVQCKIQIPKGYVAQTVLFYPCRDRCNQNLTCYLLATKHGCYSYLIEFTLECCDITVCPCNFWICHKRCEEEHCHDLDGACSDIVESIALIETALSHILNAEGEKLQKIIASTDSVEKIMCANKSIQDTVTSITHLEIVLHDKLESVKGLCHRCDCDLSAKDHGDLQE